VNSGIKTVAGLKRLSDLKLSEVKGLGKKGFDEVKELLAK
jgi:DNA-directed RNA polymerase alpha subunit